MKKYKLRRSWKIMRIYQKTSKERKRYIFKLRKDRTMRRCILTQKIRKSLLASSQDT